jgi:hypothetical protein
MQEMLEQKVDELVEKLVQIALAGDIGALRLCLDRLLRAQANEPFLYEIPRLEKAADAVGAMAGLASAAVAGDVTADEAAKLAKVISLYVNTLEAHDFEDRLVKLERADLERVADPSNHMQSTIMPKADP